MIRLGNLGGTVMFRDIPILSFKFVDDMLESCQLLSDKYLPFEFADHKIDEYLIRLFWDSRIVPETRIGLKEDLEDMGLPYYIPECIIRIQNGRTYGDSFWLMCDNDNKCWEDINYDKVRMV